MSDFLFNHLLDDAHQCSIIVNGVACQVPEQLNVAAALLYLGHLANRQHPVSGELRGSYCHAGFCFECLVTIDGQPNQRACLTQITPNMSINTAPAGVN